MRLRTYDERRYGFANFLEAVRAAGRAGLFRLERNRQGILRIFAGNQFPRPSPFQFSISKMSWLLHERLRRPLPSWKKPPVAEESAPTITEEVPVEEMPAEEEKTARG